MIYKVRIKGTTPYMQHRMDDIKLNDWEKNRKHIIERPELNNADLVRAEYHCYRNEVGKCYIPSEQLRIALINAGTYLKSKVGTKTKSMKGIVAAMFRINPENIIIPDFDQIDKRSAVNRMIKARIIVVRPKWSEWGCEFNIEIGEDSITHQTINELLVTAGRYVGIGSYRPTNNGYFGQFQVTLLEKLEVSRTMVTGRGELQSA